MAGTGEHPVSTNIEARQRHCDSDTRPGSVEQDEDDDTRAPGNTKPEELVDMFRVRGNANTPWVEMSLETERFGLFLIGVPLTDKQTGNPDTHYHWRILSPMPIRCSPDYRISEMVIQTGVSMSVPDAINDLVKAAAKHAKFSWQETVDYMAEYRAMQTLTRKELFWINLDAVE